VAHSTGCGSCREERGALEFAQKRRDGQDLNLIRGLLPPLSAAHDQAASHQWQVRDGAKPAQISLEDLAARSHLQSHEVLAPAQDEVHLQAGALSRGPVPPVVEESPVVAVGAEKRKKDPLGGARIRR